jgi:hypothetical protein
VLELLLKGGAGHRGRVSPGAGSQSTQVTNLPCGWDRVNRG